LIAGDWGVATQPFCFASGPSHRVYEPFWDYQGSQHLEWIARDSGCRTCYLAVPRLQPALDPATTQRIIQDMSHLPGWKEVSPEADLLRLRAVEVRKFVQP
jgi:hypothetical protein